MADDTAPENVAYTAEQHALFVKAFHALKAAGREPALVHCDNSAGVMLHPDWPEGLPRERCMARPGIILYGYDPSDEVRFGLSAGNDPQDRGEHDQARCSPASAPATAAASPPKSPPR
ncbi:MAG: alanine racemase [Faecalibacterium prausnitzii]